MNAERLASCHAAVDAFVTKEIRAHEFLGRLALLWQHDAGGDCWECVDRALIPINKLCGVYARSLPAGAGYRVSEEQFRSEVQSLASIR